MKNKKIIGIILTIIIIIVALLLFFDFSSLYEYSGKGHSPNSNFIAKYKSYYDENPCVGETSVEVIDSSKAFFKDRETILWLKFPTSVYFDWKDDNNLNLIFPHSIKEDDKISTNVVKLRSQYKDVNITVNGKKYKDTTNVDDGSFCVFKKVDYVN